VRRIVTAILAAAALAGPSSAGASPGWVPGFDEVTPSANVRMPAAVVTQDLRTVVFWVQYPGVRAAVRPRGGTFGDPFVIDAGDPSYVPQYLSAIALPDGDVLVTWSGPGDQALLAKLFHPDGTVDNAVTVDPGSSRPAVAVNSAGMVALAYYYFNQVYVAVRPAGSDTFDSPVLLLTLGSNEQHGSLDVTLRDDGQIAVAIGTDIVNPPGGSARMLIIRRTGTTTASPEFVDSRTLNLTPPMPGQTESAQYRGLIELLSDGRQMLVYRLATSSFNGSITRDLRGGPRDGSAGAAPLVDSTNNIATEHGLVVDQAGRPFVWWRKELGPDQGLRVARASTAGVFSASQLLVSGPFGTVGFDTFGNGRTGVLFTQDGKVKASTSEAGGAFGAPLEVATPGNVPAQPSSVALAGAGEGSAVAVWPDGATFQTSALNATAFDATAPTLGVLQAPDALTAGVAGNFTATALDDWSTPSISWLFGDGATQSGSSVQHAFAAAGSFTATATATDAVGNTAAGERTVTVSPAPSTSPGTSPIVDGTDTRAPVLSSLRLVPSTLRRGKRSTTLQFGLDEAATVVVQLQRARPGFRSAKRCVAKRPRRGTPKRCTRFVRSGAALRRAAGAGAGRLTIRRPRAKGRYRVAVYAVDAAGNRSAVQRRALTVR
jgi:hypothetical protein